MSYRAFHDSEGHGWEVWLVMPTAAERRTKERRVASADLQTSYSGVERRITPTRRVLPFKKMTAVQPGYENGWLCFESESGEKRRLVPVPDGWESAPLERLAAWCRLAIRVVKCGPR